MGKMYQDIFLDYTLNGKVTYLPGEKQQLVIGYIYDNYQKNQDYFLSGKKTTDYRNIKQTPRIDYTGTFGKHTVSVGFEGDFEYLKHYMLEDSSHVNNQLYAFYVQEDWDILDELNIVAGVRATIMRNIIGMSLRRFLYCGIFATMSLSVPVMHKDSVRLL